MQSNPKSDVGAKAEFKRRLEQSGYIEVRITGSPADISAFRDGQRYLFEIKVTSKSDNYFGAATITEWEAALKDPDRFRFVVARYVKPEWQFREYSPEEFLRFSDIPPFKIYFRIPIGTFASNNPIRRRGRAVTATLANLRELIEFRARLKALHANSSIT